MRFQFIFVPILFLMNGQLHAQDKTFVKEFTYKASDADSKISCRAIAINQLRSMLLNELGVYVESHEMLHTSDAGGKNSQKFAENISTISAGITKLDVLAETWNGETFWMKAAITVDTTSLQASLKRLSEDQQKMNELTELKEHLDDSNKRLAELTQELNAQKELNARNALAAKYNARVDDISATNSMYNAKAKFESKDYRGAIEDFDTVIKLNPTYTLAYAYRGDAKVNLEDYPGAIEDFNKAIALKPNFDAAYVDRGRAKSFSGDFQGAIIDFKQAIQISPTYANAYVSRGEAELRIKNYSAAIADFDKAIYYSPNYGMAYFGRGIAKNWLGRPDACADWNQAVKLDVAQASDLLKKYCR